MRDGRSQPLPPQPLCIDVLRDKYAQPGETDTAQVCARVARALAALEAPARRDFFERQFLRALQCGFIPAGRIEHGAGTASDHTWINCFVQPIADPAASGDGAAIDAALAEAAATMRSGGGVGYNFSRIRPRGALVQASDRSVADPLACLQLFDRCCEVSELAGARRGAQIGVLAIDHPDIEQFIQAKQRPGALRNFNLSVGVGDVFMRALLADADFDLVHSARPNAQSIAAGAAQRADGRWFYRRVRARALWDSIMRATYAAAEPGVLFLDRINAENNLAYCETIEATNPCGEQPLPAYGCCCLGSFDLSAFIVEPFSAQATFDAARLRELVPAAVRMLDNVLDLTPWPLPAQRAEGLAKRRIGVGVTGLADALIMLGLRYDSVAGRAAAVAMLRVLRDSAYAASVALARERGAFARFDSAAYCAAPFIRRLPVALQRAIRAHGMRNSHVLCIAPAGSISLAFADNVANGIEPAFEWRYRRRYRAANGESREYVVENHAFRRYLQYRGAVARLPQSFVHARQIDAHDHLRMVAALAPYIDAGISKTVNVGADYPFERFQDLYCEAWRSGIKGLTTYRPSPLREQVLMPLSACADSMPAFAPACE